MWWCDDRHVWHEQYTLWGPLIFLLHLHTVFLCFTAVLLSLCCCTGPQEESTCHCHQGNTVYRSTHDLIIFPPHFTHTSLRINAHAKPAVCHPHTYIGLYIIPIPSPLHCFTWCDQTLSTKFWPRRFYYTLFINPGLFLFTGCYHIHVGFPHTPLLNWASPWHAKHAIAQGKLSLIMYSACTYCSTCFEKPWVARKFTHAQDLFTQARICNTSQKFCQLSAVFISKQLMNWLFTDEGS